MTFKKITKNLCFHLTFKRPNLHDILVTTKATDINVTINTLDLFVLIFNPSAETQAMFN